MRFYVPESPYRRFINVQNWQLELAKEFSPNYIRIVQGMLSIAFDRAIVLGIAKKNPSRMVGNIKSKKTKVDFWTLEEFQKVTSLLYKGDYYEHYLFISFWLLFMTGMRIGEAAALQWSDIDFETGLSNINKTLYYKSMDEYKFVDPKTQASVRTIYIDADTIRELKAWRAILLNLYIQKALIFITIFCLYFVYIPSAISSFTKEQSLFKNISYIVLWNTIYISFKNSNLLLNVISLTLRILIICV